MIPRHPPQLPPWLGQASLRMGQIFLALLALGVCGHVAHQGGPASDAELARTQAELSSVDAKLCAPLWAKRHIPDPKAFLAAKAGQGVAPTVGELGSIHRGIEACKTARRRAALPSLF